MVICFAFRGRGGGGAHVDPKERSGEKLVFYGPINTQSAA